jgi:hypothetical protein
MSVHLVLSMGEKVSHVRKDATMFTVNVEYIDLSISQKSKVFANSYPTLADAKEGIKRVRKNARRKDTVALKRMDVYEGKTLIHSWNAKTGWESR